MSLSLFEALKSKVSVPQVVESYLKDELKTVGSATLSTSDDTCPFCGHRECFRIKSDEDSPEEGFYKCFSCDENGDAVGFVSRLLKLEPLEAALRIGKDFQIDLPRDFSPVQEIMNLAAGYYHQCLFENQISLSVLGNLTPLEYQTQVRKHTPEVLQALQVGFSDGGLIPYLESLGFDPEVIKDSGLVGKRGDFLPTNCFIYPHKAKGRVSHFTFKDPNKRLEYQLPNKFRLNSVMFYNQDSTGLEGPVGLVEGENDLSSLIEGGWESGVLATIGSFSNAQVKWLSEELKGRDVVTFFDSDSAGDKYRARLEPLKSNFKSLVQVKVPSESEDIDKYLKDGGSLEKALKEFPVETSLVARDDSGEEIVLDLDTEGPVLEKDGVYLKVKYGKDQSIYLDKLTDFTLELRNVYIHKDQRLREVIAKRVDGKTSKPLLISSNDKVSSKNFKPFIANAIDGSFYGGDIDLINLWKLVYSKGNEREVHLPGIVGHVPEHGGWLFRNCFVTHSGAVTSPDADGIMWYAGPSSGLKPWSIQGGFDAQALREVPFLVVDKSGKDRERLLGDFLGMLAKNLGSPGMALCMVAWAMSCAYSDPIFEKFGLFPFLFLYGRHGRGKTNIIRWILDLFGMRDLGYSTLPQLKSGVGVARKGAYYASLPMAIDEVRADRTAIEFYGTFRSWYNRTSRPMGAKEESSVRVQEVRSTFVFGGQDTFVDPALRSRCINMNIPVNGRELVDSYRWMEANRRDFSAIGYHWILQSSNLSLETLYEGIQLMHREFLNRGFEARSAEVWGIVGFFARLLQRVYMPEVDIDEYITQEALREALEVVDDDIILQFFNIVEGLMVGDYPVISGDHIKVEEGKIHLWFAESFRLVNRHRGGAEEIFSKGAVLSAIREEPYYRGEERSPLGVNATRRRVVVLDVESGPDVLKSIAESIGQIA